MSNKWSDTKRRGTDAQIVRAIGPKVKGWTWLAKRGEYNPAVRSFVHGEHGVYAIRDKDTHRVLYVGESHTGRLWKTMLRHFQGQRSFEGIGEWTHPDAEQVEVKLWTTRTPDDARDLEVIQVSRLGPDQVRGVRQRLDDDDEPVPF